MRSRIWEKFLNAKNRFINSKKRKRKQRNTYFLFLASWTIEQTHRCIKMNPEFGSAVDQGLITDRSPGNNGMNVSQVEECNIKAKSKRSARVSFNKGVRVYHHIHIRDISDGEAINCWYKGEEIAKIKAECTLTINLLSGVSSASSRTEAPSAYQISSLCFRGLEYRTEDGADNRRTNKNLGWDTVLDEQESQYLLVGERDEESIARVYSEATRHCREEAYLIGLADAQAVRQEEEEENKDCQASFKENCHPMDMERSTCSNNSQASLQQPKRRKMLWVLSLDQPSSRMGKRHPTSA
jgi:hypothetical protein